MINTRAFQRLALPSRIAIRRSRIQTRRCVSSIEAVPKPKAPTNTPSTPETTRARLLRRVHARVPKFLHPYAKKLVNAPVTHLTSFLILHEITAIVPLLGLAALFHYSNWLPSFISQWKWASDGIGKYGHYFRKKGWLREVDKDADGNREGGFWWGMGDKRFKVVLELATAYAITKALLPIRLGLCFYATPWFARRTIEPFKSLFRRGTVQRGA